MKVINELRSKSKASDFVLSVAVGLPEYYFKELETALAGTISQHIKDMLNDKNHTEILNKVNMIYKEIDEFLEENPDLLEVKSELNLSYDDIMLHTLLSKSEVRDVIEGKSKDRDCMDKVTYFLMSMYKNNISMKEYNDAVNESMNEPVHELDEAEEAKLKRFEEEKRNLELQIDWYEQIIDSFNVLCREIGKR